MQEISAEKEKYMHVQIRVMRKLMRRWLPEHLGKKQRRLQLSPDK